MAKSSEQTDSTELLNAVVKDIETEELDDLKGKLDEFHPAETANLLESMPPEERQALWNVVPEEQEGEILTHMREEARSTIIDSMVESELIIAANSMDTGELANVLDELPRNLTDSILNALDADHRQRIETALSFEEQTAGRLMSTDVISVRQDVTLAVVLRWLRRHQKLPPHTDAIMVIDENKYYLGKFDLSFVVTGEPDALVSEIMTFDEITVKGNTSTQDVAMLFQLRDLMSVPVLDEDGHLLGRITIDEVVGIIREQADSDLLKSAGLKEEEDLFAPVIPSAKSRGIWLGINLLTVFVAAWVIGQFEEALDKIVALAVLMPIVASMGGIAGSQTLTLTIRGIALNQIANSNVRWLIFKEAMVGIINGVVWAVAVAIFSYLWFRDVGISVIIAVAMVLNLVAASFSGVIIPLLLKRVGIDPALSGAVILTTVTDVIGFLSFLGLATIFLL